MTVSRPLSAASAEEQSKTHLRPLSLSIREHDICFVVPAGSRIDATRLDLPGGILILGALRGQVFCSHGSAIIAAGAEFQGEIEACDIYVEGKITSPKASGRISRLKARGTPSDAGLTGGIAAFAAECVVHAHIQARAFHVPRNAHFKSALMEVLD
jgi:hypothetical protein